MTSQIPFTPVTGEALARLTTGERAAFSVAAGYLARDQKPPMETTVTLVETIQRLISEPPRELEAIGTGPLLDPDCRDGKCGSCIGAPCEHECHRAHKPPS